MTESELMRRIQMAVSDVGGRAFRNNVAKAWIGDSTQLKNGDVLIKKPRRLHAGLCVGSSDLIGWTPAIYEGKRVAIFTAIEVKGPKGKLTDKQETFIEAVRKVGGVAGSVRSIDEALELLR